jgi:hypothetical protein
MIGLLEDFELFDGLDLRLGGGFGAIFQNVAGLAVQVFADGFERRETNGASPAGFEDGEILRRDVHAVGQIVQAHFALGQDDIQIDDDGHGLGEVRVKWWFNLETFNIQRPTSKEWRIQNSEELNFDGFASKVSVGWRQSVLKLF